MFRPIPRARWLAQSRKDLRFMRRQMPVMRFVLQDEVRRVFSPERYCFRGSVDDWICIGEPDQLGRLTSRFLKHLGIDSLYDLY